MLADDMYAFRNQLAEEGIVFCYSGYMTEQILTGIGEAIRRKLEIDHTDRNTAMTVFSVFVEQVQNVIRYSSEHEGEGETNDALRYGVMTVGWKDDQYFVSCGNTVDSRDVERLQSSLTHIQSLNKEELKAFYKETLRGEVPSDSKGAGVGFIHIARRATKGFEFDFSPIADGRSYFCLKAYI